MTEPIEMVIKRIYRKVIYRDKKENNIKAETDCLKSLKTPPPITVLAAFKNDLILVSEKY